MKTLVDYCVCLTKSSRDWLENVEVGKLPEDYRLYPGKMDHTTCVAVQLRAKPTSKALNLSGKSSKLSPSLSRSKEDNK